MLKRIFVMLCLVTLLTTLNVNAQTTTSNKYDYDTLSAILKYAGEYDVPVGLVYQVIKVESNFNPNAINKHGKYADEGLMQLNNQYSRKYAEWAGVKEYNGFNTNHNVQVGTYHLSNIISTQKDLGYSGVELYKRVLTVYNAGGTYLKKHGIRTSYVRGFDIQLIIDTEE